MTEWIRTECMTIPYDLNGQNSLASSVHYKFLLLKGMLPPLPVVIKLSVVFSQSRSASSWPPSQYSISIDCAVSTHTSMHMQETLQPGIPITRTWIMKHHFRLPKSFDHIRPMPLHFKTIYWPYSLHKHITVSSAWGQFGAVSYVSSNVEPLLQTPE